MSLAGTGTMTRTQLRTGWKVILGWVLGLLAVLVASGASISSLYDTQAKIDSYAATLSGGAMAMLNGRVAGTNTLGGVFANEFGFVVAFAVPLMAIALVSRSTRRDEEAGRLELLLASRVGRQAPLLAAVLVALAALAALALALAAFVAASGVPAGRAYLYGAALLGLGAVHTGIGAVLAQLFEHNRDVWGAGLAVIVLTYLLRGVGATQESWVVWTSPLGWYDEVRPFGDPRPAVLGLSALVALALVVLAFVLSARRDIGAALLPTRRAPARASQLLRSPFGLALHEHRGALVGWLLLSAVLMGTYGALTDVVLEALEGNPDLKNYLGPAGGAAIVEQIESMFVMLQSMIAAAFVVQAVGGLRREEDAGRMELQLVEGRSRPAWLAVHIAVVAVGAALVLLVGALVLGWSTAAVLEEPDWTGRIVGAALVHLPVQLFFLGLCVALFGLLPRWRALGWVVFAVAAVVAYMGPGMDLPSWAVEAAPFAAVGAVPAADQDTTGVVVLTVLGLVLLVAGVVGFRRRDVPRS